MQQQRLELERERAKDSPLRTAILALLRSGELTARDMRPRLPNEPPHDLINYHLGVLDKAKMVERFRDGTYGLTA